MKSLGTTEWVRLRIVLSSSNMPEEVVEVCLTRSRATSVTVVAKATNALVMRDSVALVARDLTRIQASIGASGRSGPAV